MDEGRLPAPVTRSDAPNAEQFYFADPIDRLACGAGDSATVNGWLTSAPAVRGAVAALAEARREMDRLAAERDQVDAKLREARSEIERAQEAERAVAGIAKRRAELDAALRLGRVGEAEATEGRALLDAELRDLDLETVTRRGRDAAAALPYLEAALGKAATPVQALAGKFEDTRRAVVRAIGHAAMLEVAQRLTRAMELHDMVAETARRGNGFVFGGVLPIELPAFWPSPEFPSGKFELTATVERCDAARASLASSLAALGLEREFPDIAG